MVPMLYDWDKIKGSAVAHLQIGSPSG